MKKLLARVFARKLLATLERKEGGIYKRIDENRELVLLLLREAPMLIEANPQVLNWLKSQDQFMMALAQLGFQRPERCLFKPRKGLPRDCAFQQIKSGGRRG